MEMSVLRLKHSSVTPMIFLTELFALDLVTNLSNGQYYTLNFNINWENPSYKL